MIDHDDLEARLRRQAPLAAPGPDPELAQRIRAAVRREARAGRGARSGGFARLLRYRPVGGIVLALAAAAALLWLAPRILRPEPPRVAVLPAVGRAVPTTGFASLEELVTLPDDDLRAWVDEPLLHEVESWLDTGTRALRVYSELVPAPMLAR